MRREEPQRYPFSTAEPSPLGGPPDVVREAPPDSMKPNEAGRVLVPNSLPLLWMVASLQGAIVIKSHLTEF